MNLASKERGDALLITAMDDRVDAAVAIQFKDTMRQIASEYPQSRVVLDMSEVNFLDSSGLGAVVATMKLLGPERKLELAGLTPTVAKVFRLTRMDTVFKIHATLADAFPEDADAA